VWRFEAPWWLEAGELNCYAPLMKSKLKYLVVLLLALWWFGPELFWSVAVSANEEQLLAKCLQDTAAADSAAITEESPKKTKVKSGLESLLLDARFRLLAFSILKYRNNPAELPKSLENLQLEEKLRLDPWGRQIQYHKVSDEAFLLCSMGSNGKRGGSAEAADRAREYSTTKMLRAISDNPIFRWWYSPLTGA